MPAGHARRDSTARRLAGKASVGSRYRRRERMGSIERRRFMGGAAALSVAAAYLL
jgi:hypothetical protein